MISGRPEKVAGRPTTFPARDDRGTSPDHPPPPKRRSRDVPGPSPPAPNCGITRAPHRRTEPPKTATEGQRKANGPPTEISTGCVGYFSATRRLAVGVGCGNCGIYDVWCYPAATRGGLEFTTFFDAFAGPTVKESGISCTVGLAPRGRNQATCSGLDEGQYRSAGDDFFRASPRGPKAPSYAKNFRPIHLVFRQHPGFLERRGAPFAPSRQRHHRVHIGAGHGADLDGIGVEARDHRGIHG